MRITCALLLLLLPILSFAQHWQWIKTPKGPSLGTGLGVAADASGNSYLTGQFGGNCSFGKITLESSSGSNDAFIAKYDKNGEVIWAKAIGGSGNDIGYGVTVDLQGNVFVTGRVDGKGFFYDFSDMFLSKFDPSGNLLWIQKAIGPGTECGTDVEVDAAGNSYVTGLFMKSATLGPITITAKSQVDTYLAKYDPNGNVLWVNSMQGLNEYFLNGMDMDTKGEVYVTGNFQGNIEVGQFSLSSTNGSPDIFVAKYGTEGNVIWATSVGGNASEYSFDIGVDAAGNSYITGIYYFDDTMFGPYALVNKGQSDIFIAKFNAQGNLTWAQQAGGSSFETSGGIAVDSAGYSYAIGYFQGVSTFGNINLITEQNPALYMAKYDPSGIQEWAKQVGGKESTTYGNSITVDNKGNGWITGAFAPTISLDNLTSNSANPSSEDIFIAKFGLNPPPNTNPIEEETLIPNIITPNGDGLNDTFAPRALGALIVNLKIYNRWGQVIYQQDDYKDTWNGGNLSAGTYYYLLTSATGKAWKGWVEISR
jgi:gliding motility-associated-like protein